jgi:Fic family protein
MQLARADGSAQRFYSMSAQIQAERNSYYDILENTQKNSLDITEWLLWFLLCFERALHNTDETLAVVMRKAKLWKNPATNNLNDRQKYMLNKLFDGFFGVLHSSKWAKMTKCSQDTAIRDIQDLIERGILVKEAAGGRSTSYTFSEEFYLID